MLGTVGLGEALPEQLSVERGQAEAEALQVLRRLHSAHSPGWPHQLSAKALELEVEHRSLLVP